MSSRRNILPFVTVIIPVYNDATSVRKVLPWLLNQTYPSERYEVIIVDNGSHNINLEFASNRPGLEVITEYNYLSSPYSARNRGIEIAKGDILTFLDVTNIPVKNWLFEGVNSIYKNNADIIGGDVKFTYSPKQTPSEIYDSLININMKESILRRNCAKTANLFVKREVVNRVGLFKEGIRSGEDVRWTTEAVNSGFKIGFSEKAVVYKPARRFKELLKKQWRVSKHQPIIWNDTGKNVSILKVFLRLIRPSGIRGIKELIKTRGTPEMHKRIVRLWLLANLIKTLMGFGNILGLIRINWGKR